MKKLLWLVPLLFLFPATASASEVDFLTTQVQDLEAFVYNDIPAGPVSETERVQLEGTLQLLTASALWSVEGLLDKELRLSEERLQHKQSAAEWQAEKRLLQGKQRIANWLRKNKSKPGAAKEAERRQARLQRSVDGWLNRKIVEYEKDFVYSERVLVLSAEVQLERIIRISENGYVIIRDIPAQVS